MRSIRVFVVAVAIAVAGCTSDGDETAQTTTSVSVPDDTTPAVTATTAVARTSGDPAAVEAALLAGREVRPGPYVYARLTPVCSDGCDTTPVDVYYTPDVDNTIRREAVEAWRNDASFDPSAEVWIGDPLLIGEELLTAIDDGRDVTWEVDGGTGLIVSWTIDGQGASYDCLSVDTAPLESRDRTCGGRIFLR